MLYTLINALLFLTIIAFLSITNLLICITKIYRVILLIFTEKTAIKIWLK